MTCEEELARARMAHFHDLELLGSVILMKQTEIEVLEGKLQRLLEWCKAQKLLPPKELP